jgi:ACR3 family arsenite efflux pump ArsB
MKKIDSTLFELCLGIVLYGVVFEMVLLFFSREPSYSLGLWIGIVLAVTASVHMWWSIDRSMEKAKKEAARTVSVNSLIRYVVLIVVLAVLAYTEFANPILTFFGYMGLKLSAYLNPLVHKLRVKVCGECEESS